MELNGKKVLIIPTIQTHLKHMRLLEYPDPKIARYEVGLRNRMGNDNEGNCLH